MAELLIEKGADVNVKGNNGKILNIFFIIYNSVLNFSCCKLFVTGNTVLMYAAHKGFEKIVRKLIEKGVNMNTVNEDMNPAIIFAASEGNR